MTTSPRCRNSRRRSMSSPSSSRTCPPPPARSWRRWKPTRPDPRVLHLTQQRLREKNFLTSINVPVTRYLEVAHKEALPQAVQALGRPCVLKSASFGYDGKGQVRIDPRDRSRLGLAEHGRRARDPRSLRRFPARDLGGDRARVRRRDGDVHAGREPAPQPHPRHHHRAGAHHAGDRGEGRGDRPPHRAGDQAGRTAGGRDVRDPRRRRAGERAGAAAAQFRPLDHRCLQHQPVRAVRARGVRAAARLAGAAFRRRDEEPDRRRRARLARVPGRARPPSCTSTARPRSARGARWGT